MVQCEMCGNETASPSRIKVEGAELDVCDECTDFGTELRTEKKSAGSSKYSTSSNSGRTQSGSTGSSSTGSTSTSTGGGGGRRRDMYDDLDELAQDFNEQLRSARESAGLSQQELARELNEKASLIQKLERGDTLPTDELQKKLERRFDIDLSAGGDVDETEWESEGGADGYTLGDMVKRKD